MAINTLIPQATPQEKNSVLTETLSTSIYLKREDLHPLKSHKGRSIPFMIDHYISQGIHSFTISSSGNAAIAAALHVHALNAAGGSTPVALEIYVGENINSEKLSDLQSLAGNGVKIEQKERPRQATLEATQRGLQSLRQSADPIALKGYESLAQELLEIADLAAVFIGSSSATTAQALGEFFAQSGRKIQIHVVQTTLCNTIVESFEQKTPIIQSEETSLADAIVDNIALRKMPVTKIIQETGGYGWITDNDYLTRAVDLLKQADIQSTANGALGVAGLMLARKSGWKWSGSVVCVVGGK